MNKLDIVRSADFSPCRTWRYTLRRVWDESLPTLVFVLLNPSTADETYDDPTNVRGMGYAEAWGYGTCTFVNLFAVRTPQPKVMKAAPDPIGPENDLWIVHEAENAGKVILAWGTHGGHLDRNIEVIQMLKNSCISTYCLGVTQAGHPKHILYLKKDLTPEAYGSRG